MKPGALDRGENPAFPQLIGTTILDGDVRIELKLSWETESDATTRISRHEGYFANIRADRLAVFTANPYDGESRAIARSTRSGAWTGRATGRC